MQMQCFSVRKKGKKLLFKSVLGNVEWKILCCPTMVPFKINFVVIFIKKTHKSFLKSSIEL